MITTQHHAVTSLCIDWIESPLGPITVVADEYQVYRIDFENDQISMLQRIQARYPDVSFTKKTNPLGLRDRLHEYLTGDHHCFNDLNFNPGGTPFQQQVWQALQTIPYGEVRSYGEIATQIHHPKAARAVGMANSRNPISIAIPCHRVIGANAQLTGYAGGLERKRWLLNHEGADFARN